MLDTQVSSFQTYTYEINQSGDSVNAEVPSWWSAGQNFFKNLDELYSSCVSVSAKWCGLVRDTFGFLFLSPSAQDFRIFSVITKQNANHNNNPHSEDSLLESRYKKIHRILISCPRTASHSNLPCAFYTHSISQLVLLKTIFSCHLSLGLDRCLSNLLFATNIVANFLASMLRLSWRTNYYLLRVACFWHGFATCLTS
jgi:hypothetical protein